MYKPYLYSSSFFKFLSLNFWSVVRIVVLELYLERLTLYLFCAKNLISF